MISRGIDDIQCILGLLRGSAHCHQFGRAVVAVLSSRAPRFESLLHSGVSILHAQLARASAGELALA